MIDLCECWARPGSQMSVRWRRRSWLAVFAVPVVSLVIAGVVTACALGQRETAPLTLRMRPTPPLATAACTSELTSFGFSSRGAAQLCSLGEGRSWYRAMLTNVGGGAYPFCRAKALDSSGRIVFSGPLFFNFGGGVAGLYAPGHRSVKFSWYLPGVSRPIARYVATCTVNQNPPI
jgi:hypothetical protein